MDADFLSESRRAALFICIHALASTPWLNAIVGASIPDAWCQI